MIRQLAVRLRFLIFLLLLFLICLGSPAVWASSLPVSSVLGGVPDVDPLQVTVADDGNISVAQWDERDSGWSGSGYVSRYFDDMYWGTVLFINVSGQSYAFHSDAFAYHHFAADTAEPFGSGVQSISADGDSIDTEWALPVLPGIFLTQSILYESGSTVVTKQFSIRNEMSEAVRDVRLVHGGVAAFVGTPYLPLVMSGVAQRSITLAYQDPFNLRQIHFEAASATPWNVWQAGEQITVFDALEYDQLQQTVAETVLEPACFVGWNLTDLQPETSWSGTTREDFAARSPAPSPTVAPTPMPTMSPAPTSTPSPTPGQSNPPATTSPEPEPTTPTSTTGPTNETGSPESSDSDPTGTDSENDTAGPPSSGTQLTDQTSEAVEPVPQTGENGMPISWSIVLYLVALILLMFGRRFIQRTDN